MQAVDISLVSLRSEKRARGQVLLGSISIVIGVAILAASRSGRPSYWLAVAMIAQGTALMFNGAIRHFRNREFTRHERTS